MDAHSPFSTRSTKRIQRPRNILRNFFQFHEPRDRGDNLIQGREANLRAARVGANFKKSGEPALPCGSRDGNPDDILSRGNENGRPLSPPPLPPSVWTPDFPRRRPPSPRNLPANPIRGTITTNFGAVVRGVRPPPTPFRELLLEMDTAGLLLNREYYLSSTFLRSLILLSLFLPFS